MADDRWADEDGRNLPEGLWGRLRADPARAPQHLSLAAVDHWGEQAREYARNVREQYPHATSSELAEKAKRVMLCWHEWRAPPLAFLGRSLP